MKVSFSDPTDLHGSIDCPARHSNQITNEGKTTYIKSVMRNYVNLFNLKCGQALKWCKKKHEEQKIMMKIHLATENYGQKTAPWRV